MCDRAHLVQPSSGSTYPSESISCPRSRRHCCLQRVFCTSSQSYTPELQLRSCAQGAIRARGARERLSKSGTQRIAQSPACATRRVHSSACGGSCLRLCCRVAYDSRRTGDARRQGRGRSRWPERRRPPASPSERRRRRCLRGTQRIAQSPACATRRVHSSACGRVHTLARHLHRHVAYTQPRTGTAKASAQSTRPLRAVSHRPGRRGCKERP